MTTVLGLLKSGVQKTETTTYDRSGRPEKTSWRMVRKVRPDHEEILLDGTAQSVRNGETLRDRSGRPDNINSQEVARPQNFIMGNEETELELSVDSRSFVNRVNDQVRKRQKRIPTLQEMEKNNIDESMQAVENGHKRKWKDVQNDILTLQEGRLPGKNARGWEVEGLKRRVTRKERKRLREEFEVGGFMLRKELWNIAKKKKKKKRECWKTEERMEISVINW